jgi:cytochrome c oxidase cbb3-type subunit III
MTRASPPFRALAVASFAALMLGGCDSLPGRPTAAELPIRPSAVTDFAQLYSENCAGCHGAEGKFGAALSLNNPVYLAIIDDPSIRHAIALGIRGTAMPPFAQSAGGPLTDAQIDLLIAGIRKNWSGSGDAAAGAPPYASTAVGDSNRGAQVYAENCQLCHGPDGRGGPTAGSIVDPSYLSLVSDRNLRTVVIAGRPELGHPDWKDYVPGHPLTSAQVSDLVAWLASKRPQSRGGASLANSQ